MLKGINFNSVIYGTVVFSDRDCAKIVAFWQNKRVLGIFSLRMRTNGYLGASGARFTKKMRGRSTW